MAGYAAILIASSALASWNEEFSNGGMLTLWKVISVTSAVLPVGAVALGVLDALINPSDDIPFYGYVFLAVHILVRIILIILLFYSFRDLPSGVYDTQDWLSFIPFFH